MYSNKDTQISEIVNGCDVTIASPIDVKDLSKLFQELGEGEPQLSVSDAVMLMKVFLAKIGIQTATTEVENLVKICSSEDNFTLESCCYLLSRTLPRHRITSSVKSLGNHLNHNELRKIVHLEEHNNRFVFLAKNGFVWIISPEELISSTEFELPLKAIRVKGATRICEIATGSNFISMLDDEGVFWKSINRSYDNIEKVPDFPRFHSIGVGAHGRVSLCITDEGELWNHGKFCTCTTNGPINLPMPVRKVIPNFLLMDDGSLMMIRLDNKESCYEPVSTDVRFIDIASAYNFAILVSWSGDIYKCNTGDYSKYQLQKLNFKGDTRVQSVFGIDNDKVICIDNDHMAFVYGNSDCYGNRQSRIPIREAKNILEAMVPLGKYPKTYLVRDSNDSVWLYKMGKGLTLLPSNFLSEAMNSVERLKIISNQCTTVEQMDKELQVSTFLQSKGINESTLITIEMLSDLFDHYKDQNTEEIKKEKAKSLVAVFFHLMRGAITEDEIEHNIEKDVNFLDLCGMVKRFFSENRLANEILLLATKPEMLFPIIPRNICIITDCSKFVAIHFVTPAGSVMRADMHKLRENPDSEELSKIPFPEGTFIKSIYSTYHMAYCLDDSGCVWKFSATDKVSEPEMIPDLTTIVSMASGTDTLLCLTSEKRVLFCNSTKEGEISISPIAEIENAIDVFCEYSSCFVICDGGAIWVHGKNESGLLGARCEEQRFSKFTRITKTSSVVFITCSGYASAFLLADGTVAVTGCSKHQYSQNYSIPRPIDKLTEIQNVCVVPRSDPTIGAENYIPFFFIKRDGTLYNSVDIYFSDFKTVDMPSTINFFRSKGYRRGIFGAYLTTEHEFFAYRLKTFENKRTLEGWCIPKISGSFQPVYRKHAQ